MVYTGIDLLYILWYIYAGITRSQSRVIKIQVSSTRPDFRKDIADGALKIAFL